MVACFLLMILGVLYICVCIRCCIVCSLQLHDMYTLMYHSKQTHTQTRPPDDVPEEDIALASRLMMNTLQNLATLGDEDISEVKSIKVHEFP